MTKKPTHAFLSYAREDLDAAREIYEYLTASGISTWFDKESLRPGERWRDAIERAIRDSRYFIAVISSRSAQKRGFVQTELRRALDVLDQTPDDEVFLIPVRLDECRPPIARLDDLNWLDLFPDMHSALERLVRFLTPITAQGLLAPTVRLDGVYQSHRISHGGLDYWYYLRFYSDGTVIKVSSTGQPNQIIPWFNKGESNVSVGRYTISGSSISFSTLSKDGVVDDDGEISADALIVHSYSHINGHRAVEEYRHVVPSEI
jgi:hypothetical protein